MRQTVAITLLMLLLLAPIGQAQWIDDEDDDAMQRVSALEHGHGRSGVAEIYSVDLVETEDTLKILVAHQPRPDPSAPLTDSGEFDMSFKINGRGYGITVYYGQALADEAPVYRGELSEQDGSFLRDLDLEETADGFAVELEKRWIPDGFGQSPASGSRMTDFVVTSESRLMLGVICIDGNCQVGGTSATDRAPNDGSMASYDFTFGLEQEGDIRLASPAPVRWSNGEATTFVYEVSLINEGDGEDLVLIAARDVPTGWVVSRFAPVTLQPGESQVLPVAVRIPFAHQHGTDPRFILEAKGATGTGRIELGVHYPDIPQPTGHHSLVYIHTRTEEVPSYQQLLENALGAGRGSYAFMNTLNEDDADENVRAMGFKGSTIGGDFDTVLDGEVPDYGMVYEWAIPLSPGLRVGLQTNDNQTMQGAFDLDFDAALGDVNLYGNIAVIDKDDLETGFNFDTDIGETIATFTSLETTPVAATVTVPVEVKGVRTTIDHDPQHQLVMYLKAHVVRPDAPLSPNTGVYLTGGEMTLPLDEHHDSIPVNVEFPEDMQEQAVQSLDAVPDAAESKDTPAIGPASLLLGTGLAAWRRRKRS